MAGAMCYPVVDDLKCIVGVFVGISEHLVSMAIVPGCLGSSLYEEYAHCR